MAPIAENDEFWHRLYNIWLKTVDLNRNEIKLGIFRVDYMLEREENGDETPFLVEFNTIASGAGALCCGVTYMHRALDIKPYNTTTSELGFQSEISAPGKITYHITEQISKTLLSNIKIMRSIMFLHLDLQMESNRIG